VKLASSRRDSFSFRGQTKRTPERRLWRSTYFVQVAQGRRLGRELPYALIKGAVDE
jgi:hypothetical protein